MRSYTVRFHIDGGIVLVRTAAKAAPALTGTKGA